MATFGMMAPPAATPEDLSDPYTPYQAIADGNFALLKEYCQNHAPASIVDENGYTLWLAAASYDRQDVLEWLLKPHNVDVHVVDKEGDSALHYAGSVSTARWLLETCRLKVLGKNAEDKTARQAKQEELDDMMQDEENEYEDDDEDVIKLKELVAFLGDAEKKLETAQWRKWFK